MSVLETTTQPGTFESIARSRHSVRSYDPQWRIAREELTEMLELATRAPSSSNLQPWRFLVMDDPEVKRRLHPIANNQQQVLDASAVVAVLGDVESWRHAREIYDQAAEEGHMPHEMAETFGSRTEEMYGSLPREIAANIVYTDAGLVAMQLMLAAKEKGYDSVPMGGFDKAKLVEAFGIEPRYVPVMLIAIGKAASPGRPTARLPVDKVTYWNAMSR